MKLNEEKGGLWEEPAVPGGTSQKSARFKLPTHRSGYGN